MGHYLDTTVEVTYNGKTTRVAKEDAHLYEDKKQKQKQKQKKTD
jgi:ribosomal 50S subunit-recycling heat shock protein